MKYLILIIAVLLLPAKLEATEIKRIVAWYSIESLKTEGTWKTSKGVMANGEKFLDDNFTAASNIHALGTWLLVTNTQNGKTVLVKVTDRISKRFTNKRIDLSKKAFSKIANLEQGIVLCKIRELE